MDRTDLLTRYRGSVVELLDSHEQMKILLAKMYMAVLVEEYRKQNLEATSVTVIGYLANKEDKLKTYIVTNDLATIRSYEPTGNSWNRSFKNKKSLIDLEIKKVVFKKSNPAEEPEQTSTLTGNETK